MKQCEKPKGQLKLFSWGLIDHISRCSYVINEICCVFTSGPHSGTTVFNHLGIRGVAVLSNMWRVCRASVLWGVDD